MSKRPHARNSARNQVRPPGEYARSAAELPDRSELCRLYHGDDRRGLVPKSLEEIQAHYGVTWRTLSGPYGPYRAVIVEREEDGRPVVVRLNSVVLDSLFEEQAPRVGDRIGIRYLGAHETRGYKRFALVVDRDE